MTSAVLEMPAPPRNNRMLLLVFGTGAAIGLHLGLLHVFLWRSGSALFTSLGGSLVFSATTYALWRYIFPHLGGRTLASQIARQAVVLTVAFTIVSVALTELVVRLIGAPPIFGT